MKKGKIKSEMRKFFLMQEKVIGIEDRQRRSNIQTTP